MLHHQPGLLTGLNCMLEALEKWCLAGKGSAPAGDWLSSNPRPSCQ